MDSKFDIYHKIRKLRVEYKKNPSKELEDYIEKLSEQLKQTVSSYKVFSRLNMVAYCSGGSRDTAWNNQFLVIQPEDVKKIEEIL